jgi:hypothetical protein
MPLAFYRGMGINSVRTDGKVKHACMIEKEHDIITIRITTFDTPPAAMVLDGWIGLSMK